MRFDSISAVDQLAVDWQQRALKILEQIDEISESIDHGEPLRSDVRQLVDRLRKLEEQLKDQFDRQDVLMNTYSRHELARGSDNDAIFRRFKRDRSEVLRWLRVCLFSLQQFDASNWGDLKSTLEKMTAAIKRCQHAHADYVDLLIQCEIDITPSLW